MRLTIVMLALLCAGGLAYGEEDEQSVVARHAEDVLTVMGDKASNAMDAVSSRLSEPAERGFESLVEYYTRLGYFYLIGGFASLFFALFCCWGASRAFCKAAKVHSERHCDAERFSWLGFVLSCGVITGIVFAFLGIVNGISYIASPTRHAIFEAKGLLGL